MPFEEYAFFVLQPLLTGAWTYYVLMRRPPADTSFEHAPDLTVHAVLVDSSALADDHARLEKDVADRGARLVVADIAVPGEPRHDPGRLAEAFRRIVDEV